MHSARRTPGRTACRRVQLWHAQAQARHWERSCTARQCLPSGRGSSHAQHFIAAYSRPLYCTSTKLQRTVYVCLQWLTTLAG